MAQLRNLAESFLRQQVLTHLSESETRLEQIVEKAKSLTGDAPNHALAQVKILQSSEMNERRVLPFLRRVLAGKQNIVSASAAVPGSQFIIMTSNLKVRSSSSPRSSNDSKNPSVQMKMVTELSPSDKRRTLRRDPHRNLETGKPRFCLRHS
jgi:hypothetical protein